MEASSAGSRHRSWLLGHYVKSLAWGMEDASEGSCPCICCCGAWTTVALP